MRSAMKRTTMLLAASAVFLLVDHSAADARRYHGSHRHAAQAKSHGHVRAALRSHSKKRVAFHHRKRDRFAGAQASVNNWEDEALAGSPAEVRMSQWGTLASPADARLQSSLPGRENRVAGTLAMEPEQNRRGRRAARAEQGRADSGAMTGGGGSVVSEARRWLGTNPTGRSSLWCARFMNFVLGRTGHGGTGSDLARSFASYGSRVSGPQVGAIAVMGRRGGGHVGVVSGVDARGNPIVISGNHGRRVAESVYPRGRVFAYVMPR